MDVVVSTRDKATVVTPAGVLDVRGAAALERTIVEVLDSGGVRIVINFEKVTLVTSATIRVLLMLVKRLSNVGVMTLTGMRPQVQTVFEVAGLTKVFAIHADLASAVAAASAERPASASANEASRLTRLMLRLLGSEEPASEPATSAPAAPSALAKRVAEILAAAPHAR